MEEWKTIAATRCLIKYEVIEAEASSAPLGLSSHKLHVVGGRVWPTHVRCSAPP